MKDPVGNITTYEYDSLGRVIEVRMPDGGVHQTYYDLLGRITLEQGPNNFAFKYYDVKGDVAQTLENGKTQFFYYDRMHRLAFYTNKENNQTQYNYDKRHNQVSYVQLPGGGEVTYTYDLLGRLTSETDPADGVTRYEYDVNGRLEKKTDAMGNESTYNYDKNGNLISTYAPALAAFISQDSYGGELMQPLSQNRYLYALGDPVNYADAGGFAATKKGSSSTTSTAKTTTTTTAAKAGATATTTAAKAKSNTVPAGATKVPAPAKTGSSSGSAHNDPGRDGGGFGKDGSSGGGGTGGSGGCGTRGGEDTILPPELDIRVYEITNGMNRVFCSNLTKRVKDDYIWGSSAYRYGSYRLGRKGLAQQFKLEPGFFVYDPNARPTANDDAMWALGAVGTGAAVVAAMPDAARAYRRYRENTGESLWIDYQKAYNEDAYIRQNLNAEVDKILEAAIYFYSNPAINAGSSFEMIGDII